MLLTIKTTHRPASDLGFLLGKHPDRLQQFSLSFGKAHVFYPEVSEGSCTVALYLDIDPVELVRGKSGGSGPLAQYVNDRPYAASSYLSVAIARVFNTALRGDSKERPDLATMAIPLEARLPILPVRGNDTLLEELFIPLGYEIESKRLTLDESFPEWGPSPYHDVTLKCTKRLSELLGHLYVLIPVLDNFKHFWIGEDEVDNILKKAESWLGSHPKREVILARALKRRTSLIRQALLQLRSDEEADTEEKEEIRIRREEALERPFSLEQHRLEAVVSMLERTGARRIIDLGCGGGKLLEQLAPEQFVEILAGADISHAALQVASRRLKLELHPLRKNRISLFQAALTYRDERFSGYDAVCALEVIEHIEPSRLQAFERVIFEFAAPPYVIITTPNREYNVRFENMEPEALRHSDHRFEWTRAEFKAWCERMGNTFGYLHEILPIGELDDQVGPPTQMVVFSKMGAET